MTGESKELTEPWIEQHDVRYGYAYDPGGKLFSALSLSGYPSAVLVSPDGEIVWEGHPGGLSDAIIEEHIGGASREPVSVAALSRKWPDAAKPVLAAVAKRRLGKALDEAARLAEKDPALAGVVADLQRYVDARQKGLEAFREKGDYLGLLDAATALAKSLSGHPRAAEVAAIAKAVEADERASAVIGAQKQIDKLRQAIDRTDSSAKLQAAIKKLHKLMAEHAGTYAETEASRLVSRASEKIRER